MSVYKTKGVCAQAIEFDVTDNRVHDVKFIGGCSGNTQGIAKLVEGMKVDDVIAKLEGTRCGMKDTSCPDQLTKALRETH